VRIPAPALSRVFGRLAPLTPELRGGEKLSVVAYRFNSEKFAAEVFPDEVVVLDVIEGTYFALGGSAPIIWAPLVEGHPAAAVAEALAARVGVPADAVLGDLEEFVSELAAEGVFDETEAAPDARAIDLTVDSAGYLPPVVQKNTDMQDLLTLDPIHDVDSDKGWPYT